MPAVDDSTISDGTCKLYVEGQTLSLTAYDNMTGANRNIFAKILKLHQPFTLSCVLIVEVQGLKPPESDTHAILKLYDRRFSTQLRSNEKIDPWTEATEQSFVEFIAAGKAAAFIQRLREDDGFEEPDQGWSQPENEAYLHDLCFDLFCIERRAYRVLQALQGKQIPELYSTASYQLHGEDDALLTVNGLLLEYIAGPTLSEMVDNIPQEKWQCIVDRAVKIVRDYSELGITNEDVRCSNFVIEQNSCDSSD